MTDEKIIEFYRLLANGVPLTNILWGKGKGYLQTMANATLDLISQEQSRRAVTKKGNMIYQFETDKPIERCFDCPMSVNGFCCFNMSKPSPHYYFKERPPWCKLVEVKGEKE